MRRVRLPILLGWLGLSVALPERDFAPRTIAPTSTTGLVADLAPEPTHAELSKREVHVDPNICGWFSGSASDLQWSYFDPTKTCFWNSDDRVVGNEHPLKTACFDNLDEDLGTDYLQCTTPNQYCLTFFYTDLYKSDDYHAYMCTNTSGISWTLEPTYSGLTDKIRFPIYTGMSGISTGTQYPDGYSFPTTAPTAGTANPSDDSSSSLSDSDSSSSTDVSDGTSSRPTTDSPSDSGSGSGSSSPPIGAIVGGVLGGLAIIGASACVIVWMLIRARRKRDAAAGVGVVMASSPPPPPETQPPPQSMYEFQKPELGTQVPKPPAASIPVVPAPVAEYEGAPELHPEHVRPVQEPHSRHLYEAP